MGIKCRLLDKCPDDPQIGDMWYVTMDYMPISEFSNEYKRDWLDKRLPLVVQLPSEPSNKYPAGYSYPFCVDQQASQSHDGSGWVVTGVPPNITLSPSINVIDIWHGWIRNGEIVK